VWSIAFIHNSRKCLKKWWVILKDPLAFGMLEEEISGPEGIGAVCL
jgi:hypothetical protein